jgi:hypothetical protein
MGAVGHIGIDGRALHGRLIGNSISQIDRDIYPQIAHVVPAVTNPPAGALHYPSYCIRLTIPRCDD